VDRHPLDLERFLGAMSCAMGLSALQPNDSTFFNLLNASGIPAVWIGLYCAIGIALFVSTYRPFPRCRIALLSALLILWAAGVALVAVSGPLGAFGAVGLVVCVFIIWILWAKIRADDEAIPEP